jgi:hypothetical protein
MIGANGVGSRARRGVAVRRLLPCGYRGRRADVAQLVERGLPKPEVAGSTPVVRFPPTGRFVACRTFRALLELSPMVIAGRIVGGLVGFALGILLVEVIFFDFEEDHGIGDYESFPVVVVLTIAGVAGGSWLARRWSARRAKRRS